MDFTKKQFDETLTRIKTYSANSDVFAEREKQREAAEKADWVKRNSGIRKKFFDAEFSLFECKTERQKDVLQEVKSLVYERGAFIALLYGKSGTGKTMLASCAVKERRGFYTTYEWLSARIRSSYARKSEETEIDILQELRQAPLLVIDEIDKGTNTDAKKDLISFLCRERYEDEKPTWLVGNLTWEWAKINIDSSVLDRCKENGKSILFDWDSYRIKKQEGESTK